MPKIDALRIVTDTFGQLVKFIDDMYKQGYLLYLIVGMIVIVIYVIFFN